MKRYTIVELCSVDHPNAEKIKKYNKDLGFHVYKYRGAYMLIIGDEYVWRADDVDYCYIEGGMYVFNEKGEPVKVA
jgi:hypothetical protein